MDKSKKEYAAPSLVRHGDAGEITMQQIKRFGSSDGIALDIAGTIIDIGS